MLSKLGEARSTRISNRLAVGLGSAVLLVALASSQGGFFPSAWGWSSLALLWATVVVLVLQPELQLRPLEAIFVGASLALLAWTLASNIWTAFPTETMAESERMVVYVGAALAAVVAARRRSIPALVGGTWAAITLVCGYGLLTRLFPERLGVTDTLAGDRLAAPIGYWNGLAMFASMGLLLALGLAANGRPAIRVLAGASAIVLALTLYLTFSRGATLALALGLVAVVAVDQRRLRVVTTLFVVAVWPAIAIVLAAHEAGFTRTGVALQVSARAGHRMAVVLVVLIPVAALATWVYVSAEARVSIPARVRHAYATVLLSAAVAVLVVLFVRFGSPPVLAQRAYDGFVRKPPVTTNLNEHLFSLSNSDRLAEWRIAWRAYEAHPWLGGGAGTYYFAWMLDRPRATIVHDAHNLYLETLAELGPVGLALLVAMFAAPLAALPRARHDGFATAAFGAYIAYLSHVMLDWDWELPAITVAALFCGGTLLLASRSADARPRQVSRRNQAVLGVLVVALAGCSLIALVGNRSVGASQSSLFSGDWPAAEAHARRAIDWTPWSAAPWQLLGEAQLGRGELAGARHSFRRALAIEPRNWELWLDLSYATGGSAHAAAIRRALALNPLGSRTGEIDLASSR
jgi:tetratricopeptide (TPR) repeat protein